ncbi:hypothetical protein [Algoriphagus ratkowskyi]|nr:hypothetical protein [Algoriphagus ratkowskyi]TXD75680.1 hypothetical protein ESW18_19710 [Algoriphagus ratkowskyi]
MKKLILFSGVLAMSAFVFTTPSMAVEDCVRCDEQTMTLCTSVVYQVFENGEWHETTKFFYGNKSECEVL